MTSVSISNFGVDSEGNNINKYCLKSNIVEVVVMDYGATIISLKCLDKNKSFDDVVTGFNTADEYKTAKGYFGCVVGRVANRTAKGKFTLNGKEFTLAQNNGVNHLHGGIVGFDKKTWKSEVVENGVKFQLEIPDGNEGYPGNLSVSVVYEVNKNQLAIHYEATSDQDTPINLTNHSYFNLSGHNNWGHVENHKITVHADQYTPVDGNLIPTGVEAVKETLFDLSNAVILLKERLEQVGNGYDHNFCLKQDGKRNLAARLEHTENGRMMTVETTQPGMQFYTANFLQDVIGKNGTKYGKQTAVCLETQNWPDAINRPNEFPNPVLKKGDLYKQSTWFTFDINN